MFWFSSVLGRLPFGTGDTLSMVPDEFERRRTSADAFSQISLDTRKRNR
ncbi:hypothetical protein HSB1_33730 [Halogranum salarium B-1]|uniref:Uncharacterized protein n=1 Tax=Halogranum salarium B-1 TaxID=1210908 RepID=J3JE09_9EURY|nr:hypothetical protein HSB1_33730 [Halogranum salarium B-1]